MRSSVTFKAAVLLCCALALAAADQAALQKLRYSKAALQAAAKHASRLQIDGSGLAHAVLQAATNLKGQVSASTACQNATSTLVAAARERQNWALQILDASGKPLPSGILVGNLKMPGSFWQCVSSSGTQGAGAGYPTPTVRGQYCSVSLSVVNQTSLASVFGIQWGVCIPDACSATELYGFAEQLLLLAHTLPNISTLVDNLAVSNVVCQTNEPDLTGLAIAGICVAAVFLALLLVGTVYDTLFAYSHGHIAQAVRTFLLLFVSSARKAAATLHDSDSDRSQLIANQAVNYDTEAHDSTANGHAAATSSSTTTIEQGDTYTTKSTTTEVAVEQQQQEQQQQQETQKVEQGVLGRCLAAFSVRVNGAAIFSTKRSDEQLDCLHGLRFISMVWIITGHTYGGCVQYSTNLLLALEHYLNSWSFQLFWNATFSVDTFFVISGLLTTYVTLKYVGRGGGPARFKWHLFYVHRYLRLTPVYGLMIFMYVSVYPFISSGPRWPQAPDPACTQYWWTNLLYINNFYNVNAQCFGHGWYLANDMQFFIISPLVIVALCLSPLAGVLAAVGLVGVSVISTAAISAVNHFLAYQDLAVPQVQGEDSLGPINGGNDIYVKPYCRVGSYAIGMLVGYILYRTKRKLTLNPWSVALGWATSTALAFTVLFCLYDATRGATTLNTAENAAYLSLSRIAWSISIGWIILACSTGYGGWVNEFLSWKAFAPLSRLTYCAYLVHIPLLAILFTFVDAPSDLREFPMFYFASGNVVLGYFAALGFSLTVEAPFLRLEKMLFGRD